MRAVIAESFERIHRSNLVNMGVLPLVQIGESAAALNLTGFESYDLTGIASGLSAGCDISCAPRRRMARSECSP